MPGIHVCLLISYLCAHKYNGTLSSEIMHASKFCYQSAYQGFGNDVTLNACSSNFCLALSDLEKMTEQIILCLYLFLFTHTKQPSSLPLLVHSVCIVAILLS